MELVSLDYIMRDNRSHVIMAISKWLEDYSILVTECSTVRETNLTAIHKGFQRAVRQNIS